VGVIIRPGTERDGTASGRHLGHISLWIMTQNPEGGLIIKRVIEGQPPTGLGNEKSFPRKKVPITSFFKIVSSIHHHVMLHTFATAPAGQRLKEVKY
jgi:hypothetical protein